MKTFLLFILLCGSFLYWLKGWVRMDMDRFIREHKSATITPAIVRTVGDVYYHIFQQPETASRYYQWFVEEYPRDSKVTGVYWDLGRAYEDTHKRDLALEQFAVLKDTYPATQEGQMALERYNRLRY